MKRRDFITLLGGAAVRGRLAARAQQHAMPVIGHLNSTSPNTYSKYTDAFRRGLQSTGYVEGQTVKIIHRWAEGQNDRLPALAADLVRNQVAVIAATGATASAVAAKAATRTIPIVFITGGDPVAFKLVDSFNRPGGNLTGVSFLGNSLASKQMELLHQFVPGTAPLGVLVNPTNPTLAESFWQDAKKLLGLSDYKSIFSMQALSMISQRSSLLRLSKRHARLSLEPMDFYQPHRVARPTHGQTCNANYLQLS